MKVLPVCKSQWPSNEERKGLELDTYKVPSNPAQMATTTLCIDMAGPTGFSDVLPNEWDEVSVLTVHPPNSRPQDLVFSYATRKSGPCRLRGDDFLPERPRIIGFGFT